jgi:ABC-type glycerol-3-phosphate transport system substrate-binding protein
MQLEMSSCIMEGLSASQVVRYSWDGEGMTRQVDLRLLTLASTLMALVALFLAGLAGCSPLSSPTPRGPVEDSTPTASSPASAPTTPSPAPTPMTPGPSSIALTIWGPIQFTPGDADAGRTVLRTQYEAFAAGPQGIEAQYFPKAPSGDSGVVEFLLTASYAAPSILPDVAIVDPFDLEPLISAGLAQPAQGLLADELIEDLYPFARESCTFDGQLTGVQFEADIEHLVYYTGALEEPPVTWADLFAEPISYTFPAGGEGGLVNDSFLIQYMAQGGLLLDAEGQPALDSSSVTRVLRLYDALRTRDVSSLRVLDLSDLEDCWAAYTEGNIAASHISSWRYLTSRSVMRDTTFGPLPTETGVTATMSRGWAFVIVTESPERQEAAARLIEWLMAPQNLAEWSEATSHLPARRSALRLTDWSGEYVNFLGSQLESAFYRPASPEFDKIARPLQVAVEDVLLGERSPRQAATQAIESLQ